MKISWKGVASSIIIILLAIPLLVILINMESPDDSDKKDDIKLDLVVGFYICGEGFDDGLVDEDISDTIGLSINNVKMVYLVDYTGFGNTYFFEGEDYSRHYLNVSSVMPYDSEELNLGTPEVLSGFIDYCFSIPSERHALVLWGHGRGYEGVCFNGTSSLDPVEIKEAVNENHLDLLIFDACDMITAENLFELMDSTDYILGTQKDLPDRGLNYFEGFTKYFNSSEKSMVSGQSSEA